VGESNYDDFQQLSGVTTLQREFERFVKQFGHLSDSGNDFSEVPWREDPDLILRMIIDFTAPVYAAEDKIRFEDLKIPAARKLLLRPIYHRARQFKLHREAVSSLYTYGYGLFRDYFLALGDRFVDRGIISCREEIFFLYYDEVKNCARNTACEGRAQERIAQRIREIDEYQDIIPPSTIFGDETPPLEQRSTSKMKGTPTSRGQYTGPVRVVHGIRDFDKVQDGDVLTIPYSDVGWTPLFTKAGAVIAESGGILSHSSIVAREYGIPAVVSVSGACRLEDNTIVTVDGYQGVIVIQDSEC
jgi:pyruvate,water dikinase